MTQVPQVVWLRDGGHGVWRLFAERFAGHVQGMLDFDCAVPQLWQDAAAWWNGRTAQARRWFAWTRHRRRHGMPDGVLAALRETETWQRVFGGLLRRCTIGQIAEARLAKEVCINYFPIVLDELYNSS